MKAIIEQVDKPLVGSSCCNQINFDHMQIEEFANSILLANVALLCVMTCGILNLGYQQVKAVDEN